MRDVRHLSVFALAPQPLLIELGRLYRTFPQPRSSSYREPQSWRWRDDGGALTILLEESDRTAEMVALRLGLSATITDDRIQTVLGSGVPIWSINAGRPHNDALQRREDLGVFRTLLRQAFDRIRRETASTRRFIFSQPCPSRLPSRSVASGCRKLTFP